MKEVKKVLIYENTELYNKALEKYKAHIARKDEIFSIAEGLGFAIPEDTTDFAGAIYERIEAAYADRNTLGLKGDKLASLFDINLVPYFAAVNRYDEGMRPKSKYSGELTQTTMPDIEKVRVYAETPEQIARFNLATKLIKAYDAIKPHLYSQQRALSFCNPVIDFNHVTNTATPNRGWVLTGQSNKYI